MSTQVIFGHVQSLCPKIDELRCLLARDQFDVVGINKSWLEFGQRHLLAEVALPVYQLFSVEKPQPNRKRGWFSAIRQRFARSDSQTKSLDTNLRSYLPASTVERPQNPQASAGVS